MFIIHKRSAGSVEATDESGKRFTLGWQGSASDLLASADAQRERALDNLRRAERSQRLARQLIAEDEASASAERQRRAEERSARREAKRAARPLWTLSASERAERGLTW